MKRLNEWKVSTLGDLDKLSIVASLSLVGFAICLLRSLH